MALPDPKEILEMLRATSAHPETEAFIQSLLNVPPILLMEILVRSMVKAGHDLNYMMEMQEQHGVAIHQIAKLLPTEKETMQ